MKRRAPFPYSFRLVLLLLIMAGPRALAADETVSGNLTVTGDATVGGILAVTGDIDAEGDDFTLGSQSSSYGLGTFYQTSGSDGVRWRMRRDAGWLWEVDDSGVTPSMRLDSANKLILYSSSVAGVTLDPAAKSIALGDASLYRDSNGDLKTDDGLVAVGTVTGSNLSGTNTGDQTRASLGIDTTDDVTFAKVTATGQFVSSKSNSTSAGGGQIYLNGANGNRIDFAAGGYAPPSFGSVSTGSKIVLWPTATPASNVDYAIGIDANVLWNSVPSTSQEFNWYGGTTLAMTLKGDGSLLHLKAETGANDAKAVIQAGSEGSEAHLVLSTGYTGLDRRKTAIVADGTGGWSRADLHFVLDSVESTSDYTVGADTKMIIKNGGNVGIGTTTPSAKLSINGGLHVGGDSDPGDNNLLVDGTITASNFSGTSNGTNTGDQSRASLGLDTTDTVTFAAVNTTGLVTGSNVSGTNTGDVYLTALTGDGVSRLTAVWNWEVPLKLTNPASLPVGTGRGAGWSPDGRFLSVAHDSSPYVTIYEREGTTFTKLTNPTTLPTGKGRGAAWSPDGRFLSVAHESSPYVTIYEREGTAFTKLANPTTLPTGNGQDASWSPDGRFLTVAHGNSPRLTIYEREGKTFTKLADPATLPTGGAKIAAWSADGRFLTVAHDNSPYITTYEREGATFTKLTDPTALPTGNARGASWSPDGQILIVGHSNSPYTTIYEREGTTFTKLTNPSGMPDYTVYRTRWSPDGRFCSLSEWNPSYVTILSRDGTTFTVQSALSTSSGHHGYDATWSPDGRFLAFAHMNSPYLTIYESAASEPTTPSMTLPAVYSGPVEDSQIASTVARDTELPTRSTLGLDTTDSVTLASLSATGTVTGSNLSGSNTGDQTITLTGDVTGSGTGSFAATVTESAVTQHEAALAITESQVSDLAHPTRDSLGLDTDDSVAFTVVDTPTIERTGDVAVNAKGSANTLTLRNEYNGTADASIRINRNTTSPYIRFDFTNDTSRVGDIFSYGSASDALVATSGTVNYHALNPTYNQSSGTASNTDLLINRTETAVGSGDQYLIDAKVDGTSKFSVSNEGEVKASGPVRIEPQGDLSMGGFTAEP